MPEFSSRDSFAYAQAADASSGKKSLVLAPLGAGKTHTLVRIAAALEKSAVPYAFVDLFTAASTPERLLVTLARAVGPFISADAEAIDALAREGADDRHRSCSALLRLLDLFATATPSRPFVWLLDEVTEIRSLAYFPGLSQVEGPLARAIQASRGAILTSSYLGLAADLFPDFSVVNLPGLSPEDLASLPSLRGDGASISAAIDITNGHAATLLPLAADLRDSRDLNRSLIRLLRPGGALELTCRRHYEVLLLRSRGYAVSKRAAEVVAGGPGKRLTDLFPVIGRTAGASRQYLRWLVEVGLLIQIKKRYHFADPILGLWARLYLGRGDHPTLIEVETAVGGLRGPIDAAMTTVSRQPSELPELSDPRSPPRRVDLLEEID